MPTRLFRSTWSGSRFRKNYKIESIRPQGFSEALGPAVVFGKMEKFKAWLQKASKTLQVAEIYESQRPCPNSQNEKRRAGGGDPPWGSQSAARSAAEEQSVLDRTPRTLNLKAILCLRHLHISKSESLAPPIIPPGGQRIPPDRPK